MDEDIVKTVTDEQKVMTFDEMLATNGYQAEFDKRLTKALNTNAKTLQGKFDETLNARNTDLTELQEKLKGFEGTDVAFKELQAKYQTESEQSKALLEKQAYEFAIKLATNDVKFSSKSAKDYFTMKAIEKGLKMGNDGNVLGFDDFVKEYKELDPQSFIVEEEVIQNTNTPNPTFTRTQETMQTTSNPFSFLMDGVKK